MPAVLTEEVSRGFKSSADPAICYYIWFDGRELTYSLHCTCGLDKKIQPDETGKCYYEHMVPARGWRVNLVLEGYGTSKEEVRAARRREEKETRNSLQGL